MGTAGKEAKMILFLLAAFAAHPPHAAASPAPPCLPDSVVNANGDARRPQYRRLGDLPPANQYLAVERRVNNCRTPAVVRTGIGR
jgi:hypothetical protein